MAAAQATQTRTKVADLVLVAEPSLGLDPVALESGRWTIGSCDDNRIVVSGSGISAQHCLILVVGDQLLLKSWSEQTRVNGSPQREGYLRDGDVLTLGNADFQIRRADSVGSDGQVTGRSSTIIGQIEALSDIVEELDRQLSGRRSEVERLDEMIVRIQAGLEQGATSEETMTRLRSQIIELQQTARSVEAAGPVETVDAEVGEFGLDEAGQDLRIEAAQQKLDQIIDGLEEEELTPGDPGFERQLSLRVQYQLRQLESVSSSLQGRAAVLELQAIELDGQRARSGGWQATAAQESDDDSWGDDSSWGEPDEASSFQSTDEPDVTSEHESEISVDSIENSAGENESADEFSEYAAASEDSVSEVEPAFQRTEPATELDTEDDSAIAADAAGSVDTDDEFLRSYVAGQRATLRELMDEFEPFQAGHKDELGIRNQSEEAEAAETHFEEESTVVDSFAEEDEDEEEAEIREAVTASVPGGNSPLGEVVGARRSRDEAIRQLDELIREANDESYSDDPVPKLPNRRSQGNSTIAVTDTVTEREPAWQGVRVGSFEVDLEDESVESGDAESLDLADADDSIEATFDFATEHLDALSESGDGSVAKEAACGNEFGSAGEFEIGETGTEFESSLTTDDAVEEQSNAEFPPSFDWTASRFEETEENDSADQAEEDTTASDSAEKSASKESVEPDRRVEDLRSQLAQMFDLPQGRPASGVRPQTTADEVASPVASESQRSLLAEAPAVDSTQQQSETDTQADEDEDATPIDEADEVTTTTGSGDSEHDNPDSIGDYMEALLARNRKQTGDDRPKYQTEKEKAATATGLVTEQFLKQPTADSVSDEGDSLDRSWLTEEPKHKQDRAAVRASLTTLREVANQSARSAVAQASKAQLKQEILTLTGASLICLAFAIAAALFDVNPLLPLGAVGLSLYFAVKLGIEMRHSWAILRHARQAKSESRKSSDVQTPDEVIDQKSSE